MREKVIQILFWVLIMGPNLPFWLPCIFWVWLRTHENTTSSDMVDYVYTAYPAWLILAIAGAFYIGLVTLLF